MFSHDWSNRKRGRDIEDDYAASGFSEHRQKRHIASLPHRASPNSRRHISPSLVPGFTSQPAPPTITPADSDNEEAAAEVQDRSAFSPWSSSPSPAYKMTDTQSTPMSDTAMYSDDMDMMDSVHLSPGPFTTDPSPSIAGRIPTPIHSSFSPFVRSEKAPRNDPKYINEESMVDRIRRGRRLPSPISEGETSPSVVLEGLGDMQMEVEPNERETPTKKGHSRSKHSLRNWTGFPGEVNSSGLPVKRTFSMGYRSDCDKCRMKVPGHFSHIITYD